MINEVEEWRKKFEQSELARQKMKQTIRLLKEKEVNTVQLLRQKTQLAQSLEVEQNARKKAEAAVTKYKKKEIELCKKIDALQEQLGAIIGGNTSEKRNLENNGGEETGLAELRTRVDKLEQSHDAEIKKLQQTVAKLLDKKELASRHKAGQLPLATTKSPVVAKSGAPNSDAAVCAEARGTEARVRKRVPLTMHNASSTHVQKKSKVQSVHDEGVEQPNTSTPQLCTLKKDDFSGPAADRMVRALSLIIEGDEDLEWNVVQDVATKFQSVKPPPHTLTIAVLVSAVLSCARARPMTTEILHGDFSPESWFTPHDGSGTRIPGTSYLGVWCKENCLENHTLFWLLHAVGQIDEAMTNTKKGAILSDLAKELSMLVLKDLAIVPNKMLHSLTELCTAATGAACLYRMLGNVHAVQRFIIDILITRHITRVKNGDTNLHKVSQVLPMVVAAIEVWPESVPREKGVLGSLLHGVLFAAAQEAQGSVDTEVRVSGYWLADKGRRQWGWKDDEKSEKLTSTSPLPSPVDVMGTTHWQGLISFAGPVAAGPAS
jgi:hypothetical protein